MNSIELALERLGDDLHEAAVRDLSRRRRRLAVPRRRTRSLAAVAVALVGAAGGIAATVLKSPAEQEQSLPNAEAIFIGTHPTCTCPLTRLWSTPER